MGRVPRDQAEEWARWFRALGDPTRILILNLLASAARPMTVGEITDALDVGQSTVSHHLARLAEVRFVLVERDGTSSRWQVNERCLDCFPSAAHVVMGRPSPEFLDLVECAE
ncbi:MAG: metalloregulator ArsR/SmtB family transcription factor [Actinomycetota bacterium]|nr:metalloregulator ArsR/SmtB family transcription factor [Actinomycetota bacterium]